VGLVTIALAWSFFVPVAMAQQCLGDEDGNGQVTVNELVGAVNNALDGCWFSTGRVSLSGTIANQGQGTVRVWANGTSGTFQQTETKPGSGEFTLSLPRGEEYTLGFGHFPDPAHMEFAGIMVFPCGSGLQDHFYIGDTAREIALGTVEVSDDGSFARPQHNPLEQLDHDGDGIPDVDDHDIHGQQVVDHDHDGFYDDDMDHDGFHDGDTNHDGHYDDWSCHGYWGGGPYDDPHDDHYDDNWQGDWHRGGGCW